MTTDTLNNLQEKALECAKRYVKVAHGMEVIDDCDCGSADFVAFDANDGSYHFVYISIHERNRVTDWCEQHLDNFENVRTVFEHDMAEFFSHGDAREGPIFRDEVQYLILGGDRAIIRYITSSANALIDCEGDS